MSVATETARTVSRDGITFNIDPQYWPDFWDDWEAGYEELLIHAMKRYIDGQTVVLDIGAWIGDSTLAAAVCGADRIESFEPDPVARKKLFANIALNPDLAGRIAVFPSAVTGLAGSVRLGKSNRFGDAQSSIKFGDKPAADTIDVPAITLADAFRNIRFGKKLFIKLDTEGAETEILKSFLREASFDVLRPVLYVELHLFLMDDRQTGTNRVLDMLECFPYWYEWGVNGPERTSKDKINSAWDWQEKTCRRLLFTYEGW